MAQRPSVSGSTVLGASDVLWCAFERTTTASITVWPAPFLLPQLTEACTLIPVGSVGLGIVGNANAEWFDVRTLCRLTHQITPTFTVGLNTWIGWQGAKHFATAMMAQTDVAARILMHPQWSLGIAVDALLYYASTRSPPPRLLRLGMGYAVDTTLQGGLALALDVETGSTSAACVMLSAAYWADSSLAGRVVLRTEPLSIGTVVRITQALPFPVSIGVEQLFSVGTQMMVCVEL
ncbi:MAG: hypothetical protein J5I53_08620 [Bradyrhizobiaceae bacterium]|nr:hypothetical protein [Bradyrhizobiaceae bacterium]